MSFVICFGVKNRELCFSRLHIERQCCGGKCGDVKGGQVKEVAVNNVSIGGPSMCSARVIEERGGTFSILLRPLA